MENIVKKLYGEEDVFSAERFANPSVEYAPVYNWIWNAPVSHEETDRQLDEMQRLGIRAIAIIPEPKSFRPMAMPTLMEPDYLSAPYFEEYKYMVESVKKRGMLFCLYDEGGWPSGGACGKVMLKHPEYAVKTLASRKAVAQKGESYAMQEDVLSAFDAEWNEIKDGFVFENDGEITEYYILCNPFATPGAPEVPDITKEDATKAFIEITHEGYKPYLEENFGSVIRTVFTDEAKANLNIYKEELEEQFEAENGYSIRRYLPELAGDKPATEDGARARIAWFDLCSRVLCKNFLLPQKEWCNRHNMAFIGHFDRDHIAYDTAMTSGNFNLMRALRQLDVPGVDVIWRQIFPDGNKREHPCENMADINTIFPRYASSAASQIGNRYSLTESFGVYGSGTDYNQMRYVLNYQAVRGINMYNLFGISYAREGFLMMGELPLFAEKLACYKDLRLINQYMERLSYLSSLGERVAPVALYMPVCDFVAGVDGEKKGEQFEALGKKLEEARILFDIADDAVFECVENGKAKMGKAEYSVIFVPPCRFMPDSTKAQLSKLIASGGKVYLSEAIEGLDGGVLISDIEEIAKPEVILNGDSDQIRLCIRKAQNGRLIMLFNESSKEKSFGVSLDKKTVIIDAESGRIIEPNIEGNQLNLTLPYGKMAFLWQGEDLPCEKEAEYDSEALLSDFTFRRESRTIIGNMHFEVENYQEDAKPIELGDWSKVVGEGYSGSGIYKTTFKLPPNAEKLAIDLGEVHTVCEVFINGKSLGICGMAPYIYDVPMDMLGDENILEIRVSNTFANEYLRTDSFDKWQKWQTGPYMDLANTFHADCLAGGLYGPVKIKY